MEDGRTSKMNVFEAYQAGSRSLSERIWRMEA